MTEIYKDNSETIGKTPLVRINRISQVSMISVTAWECTSLMKQISRKLGLCP